MTDTFSLSSTFFVFVSEFDSQLSSVHWHCHRHHILVYIASGLSSIRLNSSWLRVMVDALFYDHSLVTIKICLHVHFSVDVMNGTFLSLICSPLLLILICWCLSIYFNWLLSRKHTSSTHYCALSPSLQQFCSSLCSSLPLLLLSRALIGLLWTLHYASILVNHGIAHLQIWFYRLFCHSVEYLSLIGLVVGNSFSTIAPTLHFLHLCSWLLSLTCVIWATFMYLILTPEHLPIMFFNRDHVLCFHSMFSTICAASAMILLVYTLLYTLLYTGTALPTGCCHCPSSRLYLPEPLYLLFHSSQIQVGYIISSYIVALTYNYTHHHWMYNFPPSLLRSDHLDGTVRYMHMFMEEAKGRTVQTICRELLWPRSCYLTSVVITNWEINSP